MRAAPLLLLALAPPARANHGDESHDGKGPSRDRDAALAHAAADAWPQPPSASFAAEGTAIDDVYASCVADLQAADVDGDGDLDMVAAFDCAGLASTTGDLAWYENVDNGTGQGHWSLWPRHAVTIPPRWWENRNDTQGWYLDPRTRRSILDAVEDYCRTPAANGAATVRWAVNVRRIVEGGLSDPSVDAVPPRIAGEFAWDGFHPSATEGTSAVRCVDVDGDGDLDLVSASARDGKTTLWRSDGASPPSWTPLLIATRAYPCGSGGARTCVGDDGAGHDYAALAVADVDGDGLPDVVLGSGHEARALTLEASVHVDNVLAWHKNLGAGAFDPTPRVIATGFEAIKSVVVGDVDGDGTADVVAAARRRLVYYPGRAASGGGGYEFGAARFVSTFATGLQQVVLADMDGDGDADLVAASCDSSTRTGGDAYRWASEHVPRQSLSWYENLGSGAFMALGTIASGTDSDVNYPSGTPFEFRRPEVGHEISTSLDCVTALAVADVDGDGDLDVVSGSRLDGRIVVHRSARAGKVWRADIVTEAAPDTTAILVADVDADGFPDLVLAGRGEDAIRWWRRERAY